MIRRLKQRYAVDDNEDPQMENTASANIENSEDTRQKIWMRIPFLSKQGEFLI
jgi:hypothetical protein